MIIEINYIEVLVAAVVAFVVGFVWYHPNVFGTMWMKMAKISPDTSGKGKQMMMQSAAIGFVGTLISAYVLAHFVAAWGAMSIMDAVQHGFWAWLGFQMPLTLGPVLWEQKPWNLFFLNGAYWLVSTIVISVILVWMK